MESGLFRNLEFTAFHNLPVFISKLEDVNATEIIGQVHVGFWRYIGEIQYFFTEETVDLESIILIVTLNEIEVYLRYCRVWIEADDTCRIFPTRNIAILAACLY